MVGLLGWVVVLIHASSSWIAISEEAHEQYINVKINLWLRVSLTPFSIPISPGARRQLAICQLLAVEELSLVSTSIRKRSARIREVLPPLLLSHLYRNSQPWL